MNILIPFVHEDTAHKLGEYLRTYSSLYTTTNTSAADLNTLAQLAIGFLSDSGLLPAPDTTKVPMVMTWDWKEETDLAQLSQMVRAVSGDRAYIYDVITDSDQRACVVSPRKLSETEVWTTYQNYLRSNEDDG